MPNKKTDTDSTPSNVNSDNKKAKEDSKESSKNKKKPKIGTNDLANIKTTEYNFDGVELTKNPKMSYYEAKTQYCTPSDGKGIAHKMGGVPKGLDVLPPSFYNTVIHPHRREFYEYINRGAFTTGQSSINTQKEKDDSGYFRLGGCEFKIPPEFITVSETSGNSSIQTIRSSSSLITKHSYCDREIMVNLVLNGMNQINGYKVDSPFGYPHYVDGLRALIGQFKYTPFVPVVNVFLNVKHNIHSVALKNITVETVEDFPETLNVRLTLVEFNATPYTQAPNCTFDESVNWDLFNFYIQRNIRDKEIGLDLIKTNHLTNKVVFKLLKSSVLEVDGKKDFSSDLKINLIDDKYYEVAVDSEKSNLNLTKLTFATGNKLPKIQMSYYESPTFQYMGGTDTEFVMQFETTNESVIAEIKAMNSNNLAMVRDNRHKNSIGFIKVENELLNLAGTKHVVIGAVTSSTVPGFPGLYTITISGVGYDTGAKDREKFKSFRPFFDNDNKKGDGWFVGRKGREEDMLSQSKRGLANKVIQDAAVEAKLMTTELYPDLRLPKYSAIDWALSKIAKWRKDHGLEPLPFTKMPRPRAYIPGRGVKAEEYNGFVDPDFYMTYSFNAGNLDVTAPTEEEVKNNYKSTTREIFGTHNGEYNENVKNKAEVTKSATEKVKDGTINPVSSSFLPQPTVDKVVEPKYVPGYEPDEQIRLHKGNLEAKNSDQELIDKLNSWVRVSTTVTGGNGTGVDGSLDNLLNGGAAGDPTKSPKSVKKVTGNPFVDLLINRAQAGCGYVFGASQNGDIATQSYINAKRRQFPGTDGWQHASKWIGKQVWDCSSFVCWGLIMIGNKPKNFKITSGMWGPYGSSVNVKNTSSLKVGDLMYGGGHIVVYIGDNKIVHASSHKNGVIISSASSFRNSSKCQLGCRITGLEESCRRFLQANPNFYEGGSTSTDSSESKGNSPKEKTSKSQTEPQTKTQEEKPTSSSSKGSYSTGTPVLGKFGSAPMKVTMVNGKTYSFVGSNADKWDNLIIKHCKTHNLDPNFIKTILMIESGGNPNTISPANCYGLLQVHQTYFPIRPNPLEPDANIKMGCKVLADYGKYKKPAVNYDKIKWLTCFNAGPGSLQKILAGTKATPTETKNYYKKYDVFYARLIQSGGKPGATLTPTVGGMVNPPSSAGDGWGTGETAGGSSNIDVNVKVWFELPTESNKQADVKDLLNPGQGKLHSTEKKAIDVNTLGVTAGGTVLVKNAAGEYEDQYAPKGVEVQKKKQVSGNSNLRTVNTPPKTNENFQAPKKPLQNVIDEDVPTQAEFGIGEIDSLSDGQLNFNRSKVADIEDFKNDKDITERMFVDSATYGYKGRLARAFPSYMFLIIDEHLSWIDEKRFWSNYYLYQSVIEMQVHEADDSPISTARVVLTNLNRNIRDYNNHSSLTKLVLGKDGKLGGGDSDFAWWNQLSYRWFGSILTEEVTDSMIELRNELWPELYLREGLRIHIRMGYGSNPANYAPTFSGVITEIMDNGDIVSLAAQSDGAELVSTSVTDRTNATNKDVKLPEEPSDIIAALLCNRENEFLYSLTGGRAFIENTYGISHFGFYSSGHAEGKLFTEKDDGQVIRRDRYEYDIVKNIYKGTFEGKYIYDPTFFNMDGETNLRFFCYNRTPWDIMKMCEKMMPEFVAYPRPFGLENRIFYGLPWWQYKYRYERDDRNNKVYEFSKSFAQVNPINSFSDIIDNRISLDTSNLATNMVGIYSLGGDLASTPVIMSDEYIDKDKQVTRTIDTTSTQNFKGLPNIIDKALEWSGAFDNGKHNAIRVCISELIASWKNTYSGELLVIGAPEVRAHNFMYLSDLYANMSGVCKVREVVHSISGDRGYTTTIIPGLIATSTLKNAGAPAVIKSILQVGRTFDAYVLGAIVQSIAIDKIGSVIAGSKFATALTKYGPKALSFIKHKGGNILVWFRQGKVGANIGRMVSLCRGLIQGSATGSRIVTAIEAIAGGIGVTASGIAAVASIGLAVVGSFIVGILINKLLTSITDMFKYRNCINVYPLYRENRPFLGGATGQRDLHPNPKESGE